MNTSILLAGGIGSRMKMGDHPKQYMEFHGEPIISYPLKTFDRHDDIDRIIIVAAPEWRSFIDKVIADSSISKFFAYADPGETRQFSIINGLDVIRDEAGEDDVVIIHDAARPLVSCGLISSCFSMMQGYDGVLPVLPVKDTFYYSDNKESVSRLLDREKLFAGQAPESFNLIKYIRANDSLSKDELLKIKGSTEVAVKYGMDMKMIPGEERNFKVTTPDDLELFEMYIDK